MPTLGFNNANTIPYVLVDNDTIQLELGVDTTDSNIVKLGVQASGGTPLATTQLEIDGSVNGDITLTPNGTGDLVVSSWTAGVVISTAGGVSSTIDGTDGQILIGSTANPVAWADLTSTGGTITVTGGSNSLNLETAGTVSSSFPTDSGTATPSGGALTISGGTNINTAGAAADVTVNLDDAIVLATSVSSPLYTVASGDLVLNMTDDAGVQAVNFTNDSDATVATMDSLGALTITELDVDNINIDGNTIISTDTNGDITLTPNGTGAVNISYLTQFTLPIAGASGAIDDLADGLGTSGQVLTSNGAGAEPTWEDAAGGGITWNEETSTSANMAVNNGYASNNAALVTLTLPATAAFGDIIEVAGKGAGGWQIAQNAGQTIHFLSQDTTTGAGGSLASTGQYDAVELLCITANTDFSVISSTGNITVV